ncbi:hypothetical protein MMC25_002785 [Agyrium rufum]|nr:hypothetical protein [Agyrium rufum]
MATLLWLYVSRNFGKLMDLECPEPLANLYNRAYFRATWVTTALDAGFWTAMRIRKKWLRDLASMVFTLYYLIAAEQADEKVRKVRGMLTVEHLRVSWNKPTTPYLSFVSRLLRPKLMQYPPRKMLIPRPEESVYSEPVVAWLYYDGPLSTIGRHTKVVLDVPGGGFVAMNPRTHDDKLISWAAKTGLPVLSIDYRKAPEYPFPYALDECYDVYQTIISTQGRCLGFETGKTPRIVVTGDSAGGNLATGLVLRVLLSSQAETSRWQAQEVLPAPEGLVLVYPGLDMNIGNWMSDEQMALIYDRRTRRTNKNILRRKSEDIYKLDPESPHPFDIEEGKAEADEYITESSLNLASKPSMIDGLHSSSPEPANDQQTVESPSPQPGTSNIVPPTSPGMPSVATDPASPVISRQQSTVAESKPKVMKTRLATSSMISYFNDRILTPEMMRAMIILYVGPYNRPDFTTDWLLSPIRAPEALLARFPKTYFLTGERDPLVDDTVIFAGRIRQAKHNAFVARKELGLIKERVEFDEREHVEVTLIPGISHGFFQFVSIFPEGWKHIFRCARWIEEVYALKDEFDVGEREAAAAARRKESIRSMRSTRSTRVGSSGMGANGLRKEGVNGLVKMNGHGRGHAEGIGDGGDGDCDEEGNEENERHHRRSLTTGTSASSEGDEDQPLMMTSITRSTVSPRRNNNNNNNNVAEGSGGSSRDGDGGGGDNDYHNSNGHNDNNENEEEEEEGDAYEMAYDSEEERRREMSRRAKRRERLKRPGAGRRMKSLVSLASEEDLLGRRMEGLAGGLMGSRNVENGDGLRTP